MWYLTNHITDLFVIFQTNLSVKQLKSKPDSEKDKFPRKVSLMQVVKI